MSRLRANQIVNRDANGPIEATEGLKISATKQLQFFDADGSNSIGLQSASVVATSYTLTLPDNDGNSGQILSTDGTGVLSWIDALTNGDKGDITVSGNTWTIDPNAVTLSKIQQIATGTVLGRTTAGTGDVESLSTTGTGSVVLSNTPSLVTPSLGAATGTSLVLTGGSLTTVAAATQDGVVIAGRAGGTGSFTVTISPTTLTASRTLTLANGNTILTAGTTAVVGTAQTFTAAQTFRAANSVRAEAAATQDAVVLAGRAGGTGSFAVTLTPTTLTASRTVTLADGNTTLQAGTMATTGGTLAQFAATTSAELLGVISDETGTGALVFANTPTLVTPVLGAATGTSLALTGGSVSTRAAATQDGVIISGRAGGTSSFAVTLTPTTLSASQTLTLPNATGTVALTSQIPTVDVTAAGNNAFTGANTFTNATGQTIRSAATQDGIILSGRAGGTSSFAITLTPATLASSTTLTLPNVTGTVVTTGDTATVTNTILSTVPTATFKGRTTAGTGAPEDLTTAQATALLDTFTSTLKGLAPASGGGTTNFLRADGTWAAPPGGGGDVTLAANNVFTGINTFSNTTVFNGDARITGTNKARFGGTSSTSNFYIQYNSTTSSLDFVAE